MAFGSLDKLLASSPMISLDVEKPNKVEVHPFTTDYVALNEGSVARDNLANERTFLAWLRTGVSMLGLGLALAKFTTGLTSVAGGLIFVLVGMVLITYSGARYFQVVNALLDHRFSVNVRGVSTILAMFLMVGAACLFFVLHHFLGEDGR